MSSMETLLPTHDPQEIRELQLKDDLIGPLLNVKETEVKPLVTRKADPKYRKLSHIRNQLVLEWHLVVVF